MERERRERKREKEGRPKFQEEKEGVNLSIGHWTD